MLVNISGARTGEALGPGDARAHHGLEHFGFDSESLEADIARLEGFGARLLEGPIQIPNGPRIAFLWAPDDVRVELIERRKSGVAGGCWTAAAAGAGHPAPPGGLAARVLDPPQ